MAGAASSAGVVVLTGVTSLVFVALLVFNGLAGDPSSSRGLFIHGIGNVSAAYRLEVTPAGWTFAVWGVIYALQGALVLYSLANLCRSTPQGPAYLSPPILTPAFFATLTLNYASNIAWLFIWDREYIEAAAAMLAVTAVTLYVALGLTLGQFAKYQGQLQQEGRRVDIVVINIVVFNGLALYAAWTTIATTLNVGSVLAYTLSPPLSQTSTALVCLGVVTAIFVAYVTLDLTVLAGLTRWTVTPYLLLLWALAGIAGGNWDPASTPSIVVAVLGGVALLALVLKVITTFRSTRPAPEYKPLL